MTAPDFAGPIRVIFASPDGGLSEAGEQPREGCVRADYFSDSNAFKAAASVMSTRAFKDGSRERIFE